MNALHKDSLLLATLIVVGALWALVQLALYVRALRARTLPVLLRWAALVPPITPYAVWATGKGRILVVLWCVLAVAYLVLRTHA